MAHVASSLPYPTYFGLKDLVIVVVEGSWISSICSGVIARKRHYNVIDNCHMIIIHIAAKIRYINRFRTSTLKHH
jgi:hypothetical protein